MFYAAAPPGGCVGVQQRPGGGQPGKVLADGLQYGVLSAHRQHAALCERVPGVRAQGRHRHAGQYDTDNVDRVCAVARIRRFEGPQLSDVVLRRAHAVQRRADTDVLNDPQRGAARLVLGAHHPGRDSAVERHNNDELFPQPAAQPVRGRDAGRRDAPEDSDICVHTYIAAFHCDHHAVLDGRALELLVRRHDIYQQPGLSTAADLHTQHRHARPGHTAAGARGQLPRAGDGVQRDAEGGAGLCGDAAHSGRVPVPAALLCDRHHDRRDKGIGAPYIAESEGW